MAYNTEHSGFRVGIKSNCQSYRLDIHTTTHIIKRCRFVSYCNGLPVGGNKGSQGGSGYRNQGDISLPGRRRKYRPVPCHRVLSGAVTVETQLTDWMFGGRGQIVMYNYKAEQYHKVESMMGSAVEEGYPAQPDGGAAEENKRADNTYEDSGW